MPADDLDSRRLEVVPERAAVVDQRPQHVDAGTGSTSELTPLDLHVQLPDAQQHDDREQRAAADIVLTPATPSASSARARNATTAGSVRSRGRLELDRAGRPRPARAAATSPARGRRAAPPPRRRGSRARPCAAPRSSAPREPALHLGARDRVERGERLIERQHRLAGQQRAQERDPLAHPARELVRAGLLEPAQSEALEPRLHLVARPLARDPRPRAAPAPRCRGRESHGSSRSRCGISAAGRAAHRTRVRLLQAADQLEQRRLAAAARADDRDRLAGRRPSATGRAAPPPARRRDAPRTFAKRPRLDQLALGLSATAGTR